MIQPSPCFHKLRRAHYEVSGASVAATSIAASSSACPSACGLLGGCRTRVLEVAYHPHSAASGHAYTWGHGWGARQAVPRSHQQGSKLSSASPSKIGHFHRLARRHATPASGGMSTTRASSRYGDAKTRCYQAIGTHHTCPSCEFQFVGCAPLDGIKIHRSHHGHQKHLSVQGRCCVRLG